MKNILSRALSALDRAIWPPLTPVALPGSIPKPKSTPRRRPLPFAPKDASTTGTRTFSKEDMGKIFAPYKPLSGVVGTLTEAQEKAFGSLSSMAFDESPLEIGASALPFVEAYFADGIGFYGYPMLAEMSQRAEYRKPVEILAKECTREWGRVCSANNDVGKRKKIRKIERALKRLNLRSVIHRMVVHDHQFGMGIVQLDWGDANVTDSQAVPRPVTPEGVGGSKLKRVVNIDPVWVNPNTYNADNPLEPSYYRPDNWWIQGVLVDRSRLRFLVSREVPDILKPAYNFGGLSLMQMMKPYVNNFLRTRQSVSDMVNNFSIVAVGTDMSSIMETPATEGGPMGGVGGLISRIAAFNKMRSNQGVLLYDKEVEEIDILNSSLSGLDKLQAQSQEFMASIPSIPLVKLFGISPSGLNASSEGELKVFADEIMGYLEGHVEPVVHDVLEAVQLSEFGSIDEDIVWEWKPLDRMSKKDKASVNKDNAMVYGVYMENGVMSAEEVRKAVSEDPDGPGHGVDLEGPPPEPPEDPGETPSDNRSPLKGLSPTSPTGGGSK